VPRASLQFPEHNNALTAMPSPIQYWLQISFKNANLKIKKKKSMTDTSNVDCLLERIIKKKIPLIFSQKLLQN
jgi:hypothetical protein